jgi:hypothetical protein
MTLTFCPVSKNTLSMHCKELRISTESVFVPLTSQCKVKVDLPPQIGCYTYTHCHIGQSAETVRRE